MERNKTKIRESSFLIISILLVILSFIVAFLSYKSYQNLDNVNKKNKHINSQILNIKKEYEDEKQNTQVLQEEEKALNSIDDNIISLKDEVFNLASKLENKILDNQTNYKIAYITFDDGPYYSTNEVLDILDNYKIKATFFTIGLDKDICYDNKEFSCSETYKKEVEHGHTIANHTYSHSIFRGLYSSTSSFINDVKKQESLIEERTGVKTNIVRFPGGSSTAGSLKNSIINELRNMGYGWIDWTAGDGDGGYVPNSTVAWNNFTSQINENIEVILFHDYSKETITILPQAIEYLENNNYILLPLFYDSVKVNK